MTPRYLQEFRDRGLFLKYGSLVWRFYLAKAANVEAILALEEQNRLIKPPSLIACVGIVDYVLSRGVFAFKSRNV